MTIEQIRMLHQGAAVSTVHHPLGGRPIRVRLAQRVPSAVAVRAHDRFVYKPDESSEVIDLLLVTSLAMAAPECAGRQPAIVNTK